jgi:hypothetical protein
MKKIPQEGRAGTGIDRERVIATLCAHRAELHRAAFRQAAFISG